MSLRVRSFAKSCTPMGNSRNWFILYLILYYVDTKIQGGLLTATVSLEQALSNIDNVYKIDI